VRRAAIAATSYHQPHPCDQGARHADDDPETARVLRKRYAADVHSEQACDDVAAHRAQRLAPRREEDAPSPKRRGGDVRGLERGVVQHREERASGLLYAGRACATGNVSTNASGIARPALRPWRSSCRRQPCELGGAMRGLLDQVGCQVVDLGRMRCVRAHETRGVRDAAAGPITRLRT